MMLTMSQRPELRQELAIEVRLEQRVLHQLRLAQCRLELVAAIHDRSYVPVAHCPNCGHDLNLLEILKGFNADPQDRTTKCPECQTRFPCHLTAALGEARVDVAFFCAAQTRWFLRTTSGANLLTPEEMEKTHPAYYHSAIAHFGSLTAAFKLENLHYSFVELPPEEILRQRITPFFGKLADRTIARVTGVPQAKIQSWRMKAKKK